MRTLTIPDLDPFEEENAQDYIHHVSDSPETKKFSAIYIEPLDDPFLSRGAARAFASRLLALADEWDRQEATPPLRRLHAVDDHFRDRDI
jgi:hypothetical protein